ncbi:MAG: methyltransferase domain-containing protein [Nitrospirota bacterium]
MDETRHQYIPALRFGWLTRLYDPVIRWTMREDLFKPRLVEQVGMQPGHRVLDLGCGTATLTILLKRRQPQSMVIGLDGDAVVLARAREKVAEAGVDISFDEGMAYRLPYPDRSFDRVVASLLLHHLTSDNKRRALCETFRVLKPGGELHIADFGRPHTFLMACVSLIVRWLEETYEHVKGLMPGLIRDAGFTHTEETGCYTTAFGTLVLIRAVKPEGGAGGSEGRNGTS